jgi:hypothetical protein
MQALDSLIDWNNVFAKPAAIMEALAGPGQKSTSFYLPAARLGCMYITHISDSHSAGTFKA